MANTIVLLTIQNNTGAPVGPYGLSAITVQANASVNVSPPLNGLLSDSNFFGDLMSGVISILTGGQIIPISGLLSDYLKIVNASELSNSYKNITGNATTLVKSGSGVLHAIIIGNNNTGGSITIYDNTAGNGTVLMTLQLGSPSGGLLSTTGLAGPEYLNVLNLQFNTGLTIVTSGSNNNNVTVIYQ